MDDYVYTTPLNGDLRVVCRSLSRRDVQVQAIAQIPQDAYPLACAILQGDREVGSAVVRDGQGLVDFLAQAAQTQGANGAATGAADGNETPPPPGGGAQPCPADARGAEQGFDRAAVTLSALTCLAGIGVFSLGYIIARA